jgi:hypothetical protein
MKILARLPEKRHFRPITGTERWPHIWEAIYCDRLRVCSQILNPWPYIWAIDLTEQKAKTDKLIKTNRVDLHCVKTVQAESFELILETQFGGVPHSDRPTIRFYALPNQTGRKYLMLSVCEITPAPTPQISRIPIKSVALKKVIITSSTGGAEFANADRTNDERAIEVSQAIKDAVAKLLNQYPHWFDLPTRTRIELLQAQTRTDRGFGVSSQTLYRDWNRELW